MTHLILQDLELNDENQLTLLYFAGQKNVLDTGRFKLK